MGASRSRPVPVIQKYTQGGENDRIKYALSTMQDSRKNKKDTFAVFPNLDGLTSFFGVYDGHQGAEVALFCAGRFHTEVFNHPDYEDDLANALRMAFFRMDELLEHSDDWAEFLPRGRCGRLHRLKAWICAYHWPFKKEEDPYVPPQWTGSTACVVAIRGQHIIVGNVGRSRCIISRGGEAVELTTIHKPSHQIEAERIRNAGGQVTRNVVLPGEADDFFQQQGSGIAYINGTLDHARAIGLFAFKRCKDRSPEEQMVTCDPEIHNVPVTPDIEFLIIVSDGIWAYLTSQGVVDFVRSRLNSGMRRTDLRSIAESLCDRCQLSGDHATAILVQFKAVPPPPAPPAPAPAENLSNDGASSSRDAPPSAAEDDDEIVPAGDDEAGGGEEKPLLGDGADSFSTAEESL